MKLIFTHVREFHSQLTCNSKNCSELQQHSHYDKTDPNPFFYRFLSQGFLAVETALLKIFYSVSVYTVRTINSQAFITKINHVAKPLPLGIFVLKRIFFQFSNKPKWFGLDHTNT